MIRRATRVVELHSSRFASHVDQAREQARAANDDRSTGEVTCDRGQLILLAHPLLVAREAERSETAGDNEEYSNDAHPPRIGTGPDGLEKVG